MVAGTDRLLDQRHRYIDEVEHLRRHGAHKQAGKSAEPAAAHHHLTLDQPLAFVSALRAILGAWLASE